MGCFQIAGIRHTWGTNHEMGDPGWNTPEELK